MKPHHPILLSRHPGCSWVVLALLGAALSGSSALAATTVSARTAGPTTPTNALPAVIPKSAFAMNSPTGRDPFFPLSTRRAGNRPATAPSAPASRFPEEIRLNGISVTAKARLVIINGRTLAENETTEIKIDGRPVRVHVEAIKDTSAMVTAGGVTKELHLRAGH